jgi:1A family penicillin-binding protein
MGIKRGKRVHRSKYSFVKIVKVCTIIGIVLSIFIALYSFWWISRLEIPSIDGFDTRQVEQSTKIYDRTGEVLLFDIHGDVRRTVVPLEEISRHLRNATIAIEDTEFYQHAGIRPSRTLKAVFDNITSGNLLGGQGGSTLTQQVVKNVYLSREKTITRKVQEWVLALALEKKLTKDEILSVYLNEMPYGGTIYGAQEASKYFFGEDAIDLSLAEAAYLAALPQRPSYFSPHGNNFDALEKRKNLVLSKMLENNFITENEYATAIAEDVTFNKFRNHNILAPHFVFYIRDYLEEKYGEEAVSIGGLKVTTTIDTNLQEAGERIINRFALENETKFNAENAALVAIDPKTGQILAMVGSRDYFDETIDGKFNVATAERQPGSTFKPIVYGTAFEKGYTASTVLFDLQTQFSTNCLANDFTMDNNCYSPVNYDGKFQGPMILRNALAQSVNIPAVKLLHLIGIESALTKARAMGIESLTRNARHYGLSLVLGGGEVTPLELTGAYGVFANDGVYHKQTGILKIEDAGGTILEEFKADPTQALSVNAARTVSDVLSDNVARTPAYGARSFLYFDNWDIAAKTGTTNDFRDVWVVGYTPNLAVGTWAGNNDNSPIVKKVAGFVIAPMWRAFMDEALPYVVNEKFTPPEPLPEDTNPILTGDWSTAFAQSGGAHSILHLINKEDPQGPTPADPSSDSQYANWEYPVQLWANGLYTGVVDSIENPLPINTPTSTVTPSPLASMQITYPIQGSVVTAGIPITIQLQKSGRFSKVEYFLNGAYVGASVKEPFTLTIVPQKQSNMTTIQAIAHISDFGSTIVDSVSFSTQ